MEQFKLYIPMIKATIITYSTISKFHNLDKIIIVYYRVKIVIVIRSCGLTLNDKVIPTIKFMKYFMAN